MERMKKAISLLLVVAMLLTNCPVTAFASDADVLESGAFRYEVLEDGTLSICGYTGEPEDGLLHLEIPETLADTAVTQISGHAFEKAEVTTIAIPESIRRVADEAFAHCETLKAIAFCGPMPEMGKHLIEGCSSLEGVYLLAEEDATAQHAVLAAAGLTDIYLWKQEDLESLEAAFGEYKNDLDAAAAASEAGAVAETTEETIPETVSETTAETIPETVPETTVETISEETEPVTETWPEKIIQTLEVTVSQPASTGTGETTGFTYSVLNETQCAITGYTGTDTEIVIPAEIDGYQVHTIQSNAFKGKTALTSITLPEGLKRIESYAFQDCKALTYIDLPDSITEMANFAFRNCTALAEIGYPAGWTTTLSSSNNTSYGDASVYYGTPFTGCNALKTITVDEGVTAIPAHAFRGMTSLEIIHLPESLTTIGVYAFAGCTGLKAIEIPRSVTTINANSLEKCSSDLTIYCYNASAVHTTFENSGYTLYFLDEHDHVFSTEVQKAPTCAENGSTKTTCAICGYYYIEVQKAQGHSFGPWKLAQDSGCETGGSQYRVCTVCETEQTRELPANGHDYEDTVVLPTCSAQGRTVHICKVCGESYADAYVDPLQHSFGDWSTITEATVLACGIRTRVCSVCGVEETEEIPKVSINVEENQNYGMANFLVMDAVNLVPVSGASIFIATENDGEITLITDGEGKVSHVLPVGKWKASVCADGYIVRNITITVEPGVQDMPIIGISDRPMVDAKITVEEMTYEEMIAAGIDVGAKDNRHYYKWKCEIRFHEELYIPLDPVYKDSEGKTYTAPEPRPKTNNVFALSHEGAAVSKEHVTVYSSKEHGTYIKHRSSYENAIWTPEMGETIAFRNNGYYFEGYGLPSELTMTTQRAFPDIGWTQQAGTLAMKVGTRTHYLTYQEEEFRTVSSTKEVKSISLFEQVKVENDNYPTTAEYVYVPVSEPKEGGKYLLVQFDEAQTKKRDALSHEEDLVADVRMRIHRDDVLGEYITVEEAYRNAYWTTSYAQNEGLRILNNQYFGFAGEGLTFDPVPDADGWTLEEDGRLSTINSEGETVYLLYTGDYSVTKSKSIASSVTLYQKTTVQDLVDGSGKLEEKTIYRFADTFQEGEEYVIFGGSIGNGGGGGSSLPDGGGLPHPDGGHNPVRRGEGGGFNMPVIHQITEQYYLIIYGEVSWLKEMFEVELLVLNNSGLDPIKDCTAYLTLPEGLSLATMVEGQQSMVQSVDQIPTGGQHSFRWYIRGDAAGSYNIGATLTGMLGELESFSYYYETKDPIQVLAGNALKLTFKIPDVAYKTEPYVVTVELENVSDKVLYNVDHMITGWEQGKVRIYEDGKEEIVEVTAMSQNAAARSVGYDVLHIRDNDTGEERKIAIEVLPAHTCHSDVWTVDLAPTATNDGFRSKLCDTCGDIIAMETLTACTNHDFGAWITEKEATTELMGIQYRECRNCCARETEFLPKLPAEQRIALDAEGFRGQNTVWIDGEAYAVQTDEDGRYVIVPNGNARTLVTYTYNASDAVSNLHRYPIGMQVWMLEYENGAYAVTRQEAFDDILQYSGMSIRVTGKKGIRMITSIEKDKKKALVSGGLEGYTLKEYGTVVAWASQVDESNPLVLGKPYAKSNYAYKKGVADPVFAYDGDLMQYTNVLVNFSDEQCKNELALRPYMILKDADGKTLTIYGGILYRSIGYIAYQNRDIFEPQTAEYNYIWDIIHYVYGDVYDDDFIHAWTPPNL